MASSTRPELCGTAPTGLTSLRPHILLVMKEDEEQEEE